MTKSRTKTISIRGGAPGTIEKLKKDLAASSGGEQWIKYIPADDSLIGRFLTEPNEFFSFFQHYDDVLGSYPCIGGECPGCEQGDKPRQVYLANFVIQGEDRTVPLQLPKSLINKIMGRYERRNTVMDRDYELIRTGSGLKTEYDLDAEAPSRFNTKKFDLLDLEQTLIEAYERAMGNAEDLDDDDEDDDEPRDTKSSMQRAATTTRKDKKPEPLDEDDFDEDVEDDEDDIDDDDVDEATLRKMSLRELRAYAIEKGMRADVARKADRDVLIEAVTEASTDGGGDEDLDDDDEESRVEDEAPAERSERAGSASAKAKLSAVPDDGDDDDVEEIDEDEVRKMKLPQLRALAKKMGVQAKRTDKQPDLIEKILDAAVPF